MRFQLIPVDHMKRPIPNRVTHVEECEEKPRCGALVLDDPLSRQLHREFHEAQEKIEDTVEDAIEKRVDGFLTTGDFDTLRNEIQTLHAMYDELRSEIDALETASGANK